MESTGLGWKIFGLFVSIGMILGGLSGDLVLRGTDSSTALVVLGLVLMVADIVSIATHKSNAQIAGGEAAVRPMAVDDRAFGFPLGLLLLQIICLLLYAAIAFVPQPHGLYELRPPFFALISGIGIYLTYRRGLARFWGIVSLMFLMPVAAALVTTMEAVSPGSFGEKEVIDQFLRIIQYPLHYLLPQTNLWHKSGLGRFPS